MSNLFIRNLVRHPQISGDRFRRLILLTIAAVSVLLGLTVIAAWHLHLTATIQVIPNSPPIRYNTALAFLLSGVALGLLLWGKPGRASIFSLFVSLIGAGTLAQYRFGKDLGIDQLLMQDYITQGLLNQANAAAQPFKVPVQQLLITVEQPFPGRSSPNLALAITFIGIALLCLCGSNYARHQGHQNIDSGGTDTLNPLAAKRAHWQDLLAACAGTLAAGVIGISAIALLGYLTKFGMASTWRYLIGITTPTALGLMLLGWGLLLLALSRRLVKDNPWWFPLSIGFGVFTASLIFWQALISWSRNPLFVKSGFSSEVEALLIPVANIVLIGGIVLALVVMGALYFGLLALKQAKRLKVFNHQIAQSQALLKSTLEATADGILVFTPELTILYFNPQLTEMWQIPDSIVASMKTGISHQAFPFAASLVKHPETFLATTQLRLRQLESEHLDIIEFKDGRIFERYSHPHWIADRAVGKVFSYRDVTARTQAEEDLRQSESRFHAFMNNSPTVVFMKDAQGRYVYGNETLEQLFNLKIDLLQGKTDFDLLPLEIAEQVSKNDANVLTHNRTSQYLETVPTPDGTVYHWLTLKFPFQDQAGHRYVGGIAVNITERQKMEESLFQEKELAQVTLDSIGDAVITTDAVGNIRYLNPVAESLTGWPEPDAQGRHLSTIFPIFHEATRAPVENPIEKALREDQIVGLETQTILSARDGREIAIDHSAAPIHSRKGEIVGAVMVFHDVTQARELSRQFSWQAKHDPLTGLVNRREFEHHLEAALATARSDDQTHALCYMDLDQFKIVNDTCGHVAGDELLRQVTVLLQEQVRKTDVLARLGGDEFGVLLTQCPLDQASTISNLLREKIQAFRFIWQGNSFAIGVSIGLVEIQASSESLANLLIEADTACYAAKNNGRNRIHVFQRDDQDLLQHQGEMRWVNRLTRALEENRFVLYAQRIAAISITASQEEHYEVLLRLEDEDGKLVLPMAFIPAAERYSLMAKIDRWVIRTLFSNWSSLQINPENPTVQRVYAINLSGASINDLQFIDFLHEQFAQYAIPPQMICFEVTETVAIANLTQARRFILKLQEFGCRFALDDFGSGMSSFGYLKNLPVNYLKIDGEFIKNMVNDPVDYAMVEAINHIGHVMSIQTIAEWVENDAILECLKGLGVDYAQGYGIGKTQFLVKAPSSDAAMGSSIGQVAPMFG